MRMYDPLLAPKKDALTRQVFSTSYDYRPLFFNIDESTLLLAHSDRCAQ